MSPAFIRGVREHLPNAGVVFDRYHVAAQLSGAVDEVRRAEAKTRPELLRTRYLWLRGPNTLSTKQMGELGWLLRPSLGLATARAWHWKADFDFLYAQPPAAAEQYLRRWCAGAKRSRLEPIKRFVRLIEAHWDGILAWHRSNISNGIHEGTNSLIQAAKRKARGYRNDDNLITMIYLIAGRLPLPAPHSI
jgi:transposase